MQVSMRLCYQRLCNIIFRKRALKLGKQTVAFGEGLHVKTRQATQNSHVSKVYFERSGIVIRAKRHARRSAAIHLMNQLSIHKPLQSIFILARASSLFYCFIQKFFVFTRQLSGKRIPYQGYFWVLIWVYVLQEIVFVRFH